MMNRGCLSKFSQHIRRVARSLQTACTVHHQSLTEALTIALKDASAPHHGFTPFDMPSHALVLVSRPYFPETDISTYAQTIHSSITKALGNDAIDVISAVVDDIPSADQAQDNLHKSSRAVSLLIASEDERTVVRPFEDRVDRAISLGRAWKSQGDTQNQETIDDGWVPSGDWKDLLGGGTSKSPSEVSNIVADLDVKSAIVVTNGEFAAIDWPAQMFPNASTYGLAGAKTPFLTGLPITLSHNGRLLKGGGVAIGFTKDHALTSISRPRLKKLGKAVIITKAQGNILIEFDNKSATHVLLESIRSVIEKDLKISKDVQIFGEILHQNEAESAVSPMIKVIGGDHGRGSIALNGGYRVREGDKIVFYYDDPETTQGRTALNRGDNGVSTVFECIEPDSGHVYEVSLPGRHETNCPSSIQTSLFGGASCAGIILGTGKRTWLDESVGAQVRMN